MWKKIKAKLCELFHGHHFVVSFGNVNVHLRVRQNFREGTDGTSVSGVIETSSELTMVCPYCSAKRVTTGTVFAFELPTINLSAMQGENQTPLETLEGVRRLFKAGGTSVLAGVLAQKDIAHAEIDSWTATLLVGAPIISYNRECTIVEADYVHCD